MRIPLKVVRLLTRKSPLAMRQAEEVASALRAVVPGLQVELVGVSSAGDVDRHTRLDRFPEPGVFTKALEEALLDGVGEAAVHSAKDVPTTLDPRFTIAAFLGRRESRDVVVVRRATALEFRRGSARRLKLEELASVSPLDLPLHAGAVVATGSPRRRAMLAAFRPDLLFVDLRGNLGTRLRALSRGADAVVTSAAALSRMGFDGSEEWDGLAVYPLDPELVVPQAGQGAVAVETRSDSDVYDVLAASNDDVCARQVQCERAFLGAFGGGCSAPLGVHAEARGSQLRLVAAALTFDGRRSVRTKEVVDGPEGARVAGARMADLARGALSEWSL